MFHPYNDYFILYNDLSGGAIHVRAGFSLQLAVMKRNPSTNAPVSSPG